MLKDNKVALIFLTVGVIVAAVFLLLPDPEKSTSQFTRQESYIVLGFACAVLSATWIILTLRERSILTNAILRSAERMGAKDIDLQSLRRDLGKCSLKELRLHHRLHVEHDPAVSNVSTS